MPTARKPTERRSSLQSVLDGMNRVADQTLKHEDHR
jgi:hypothetical protein